MTGIDLTTTGISERSSEQVWTAISDPHALHEVLPGLEVAHPAVDGFCRRSLPSADGSVRHEYLFRILDIDHDRRVVHYEIRAKSLQSSAQARVTIRAQVREADMGCNLVVTATGIEARDPRGDEHDSSLSGALSVMDRSAPGLERAIEKLCRQTATGEGRVQTPPLDQSNARIADVQHTGIVRVVVVLAILTSVTVVAGHCYALYKRWRRGSK